ncbi:MAG: bifunctional YncE family protein/alkaline phosphatase family protein [Cytophagales bacterium]|nr:bifunctional YncE family protein/alkaline phosphatase family protein [Armatimonadota bacterium]
MRTHFPFSRRVAALGILAGGAMGAAFLLPSLAQLQAGQTPAPTVSTTTPLVTGKSLTPQGTQTNVGSIPANAVLSPGGRFVLVSSLGDRAFVSVLSVSDGALVSQVGFNESVRGSRQGLYYGLAFGPRGADGAQAVYAARGADDLVSVLSLTTDGKLTDTGKTMAVALTQDRSATTPADAPPKSSFVAGLATDTAGTRLYAASNTGDARKQMNSVVRILDTASGTTRGEVPVPGYPYAVTAVTKGPSADRKVYVGSEQRGVVSVIDPTAAKVTQTITTGDHPLALLLSGTQDRLYVANAGSDTVSIISTANDRVQKTILLRPADVRGLPGATPTGLALSPDEKTLYVTLGDMNAVAVVDPVQGTVRGYLPVGWYPTAVVVSPDGKRLFVVNAKGVVTRTPNDKPVAFAGAESRNRYIQNILEGTVSTIDVAAATAALPTLTAQTLANNRIVPNLAAQARTALKNPGIKHVIYIIKENRTYDQVLGDLPQGNGDPSQLLFGRDITPNQHALAERFALLDNFYCSAEVSGDGWNWSTAGMANPYVVRNVPYGYTGRKHPYDYEGTNNGVPVDLLNIPDVSRPSGGYLWDAAAKAKLDFRNYGFFADDVELPRKTAEEGTEGRENTPVKKALEGHSSPDFRQYDTTYADSDAWVIHKVPAYSRQLAKYGRFDAPSRFSAWKREFDGFVASGKLPQFTMIRMGNDHTMGTRAGVPSPRAMVADNDYAVGQLVEAVSRSPFWKSTAIFIVEDDAQNGYDHVDAHRSISFVISPFVTKGTKDSRFYNTDSTLHTMENLLGLPPLNQYDAIAPTLNVFAATAANDAPYSAILPAREIVAEVNKATAYRAKDSARLLNPLKEESGADEQLNDILWHAIKGRGVPAPPRINAFTGIAVKTSDHRE